MRIGNVREPLASGAKPWPGLLAQRVQGFETRRSICAPLSASTSAETVFGQNTTFLSTWLNHCVEQNNFIRCDMVTIAHEPIWQLSLRTAPTAFSQPDHCLYSSLIDIAQPTAFISSGRYVHTLPFGWQSIHGPLKWTLLLRC